MALNVALYTAGRFVFENMRGDFAHTIGGLRINAWVSFALRVGGIGWFAWLAPHGVPYESLVENEPQPAPAPASS